MGIDCRDRFVIRGVVFGQNSHSGHIAHNWHTCQALRSKLVNNCFVVQFVINDDGNDDAKDARVDFDPAVVCMSIVIIAEGQTQDIE